MSPNPEADTKAQADFERARFRSFFHSLRAYLTGDNNTLISLNDVRKKLRLQKQIYRGLQEVPVAHIIGSENRFADFDKYFLPRNDHSRSRWKAVYSAWYTEKKLPPVVLYKVGDSYFVQDGNHRVSVAKQKDIKYIDAEVIEIETKIPIASDLNWRTLAIKAEYSDFLEKTKLDELRPQQQIEFSTIGCYQKLIDHIAVHRYYMTEQNNTEVSWSDAVCDWYDNVYCWIRDIIRKHNILNDFTKRTESDLYLWIIEHQFYLSKERNEQIDMEEAALSFKDNYSERPGKHFKKIKTFFRRIFSLHRGGKRKK